MGILEPSEETKNVIQQIVKNNITSYIINHTLINTTNEISNSSSIMQNDGNVVLRSVSNEAIKISRNVLKTVDRVERIPNNAITETTVNSYHIWYLINSMWRAIVSCISL